MPSRAKHPHRIALIVGACLLFSACAHVKPDIVYQEKQVKVPVPVACDISGVELTGPTGIKPDDDIFGAAKKAAVHDRKVTAERDQLRAAVAACNAQN